MTRLLCVVILQAGLLTLGACAPAASVPSAGPEAAGRSAGSPSPAPQSEWDRVLAAAKQEGKVAVIGPTGVEARDALVQPFEEKYGISVEFFGASNRDLVPKVRSEREAGQYAWDVRVGGAIVDALKSLGALEPLEPALLQPEVKDVSNWRDGELEFSDANREILVMTLIQRGTLMVNTNLVRADELRSYKDLLDPRFKGRLVADDPRNTGPGEGTFTFMYLHPELGPDFIRALARQDLTIMKDYQQEVDAVGQGRYPVLVGVAEFAAEPRMKQGVPIAFVDPRQLREGSHLSPTNGELALFNRSPHPNAAKVYVNWLLSKEGQTTFAHAMGYISNRVDVPTDHIAAWRHPQRGSVKPYLEEYISLKREKLTPLLTEVFGR
jgi:iron(III) transport system substrate-binding protein